jgi:3-methyl-2-oxobutanoate hydroxymethyltransferase
LKWLDLLLWSMGSGPGCDAQYLFAEDILGENKTRLPRHAKAYRNFAAEYERLQAERVKAFAEFRDDVASGAFPEDSHVVRMAPSELEKFLKGIGK